MCTVFGGGKREREIKVYQLEINLIRLEPRRVEIHDGRALDRNRGRTKFHTVNPHSASETDLICHLFGVWVGNAHWQIFWVCVGERVCVELIAQLDSPPLGACVGVGEGVAKAQKKVGSFSSLLYHTEPVDVEDYFYIAQRRWDESACLT